MMTTNHTSCHARQSRFEKIYTAWGKLPESRNPGRKAETAASHQVLDLSSILTRTEIVLMILIAVIVGLCLLFFCLAILRRLYNARKYAVLDQLRKTQMFELKNYIHRKAAMEQCRRHFEARPGSMKWLAIEHNLFLLMEGEDTREASIQLFEGLGYVDHYLEVMKSRKVIARALAASKLGRMGCPRASAGLLALLDTENHELIAVTVRAVSKLGDGPSILVLLSRLPDLLQKNLVTRKTVDASLAAAGPGIVPLLLASGRSCSDTALLTSIMAVFNDFPATREICDFAVDLLHHPEAEVRAKAVKLMAHCVGKLCLSCQDTLPPLLNDPVWYVRLQAVRALGYHREEQYAPAIAALVLDEKWHVRNEAALALTLLGKGAVGSFRSLLRSNDRYAKESVCEEIEKTDYVGILLDLLDSSVEEDVEGAKEILSAMAACGFTSSMKDYLASVQNPAHAALIQTILNGGRP